jgi:S1-C subfamily serine protease
MLPPSSSASNWDLWKSTTHDHDTDEIPIDVTLGAAVPPPYEPRPVAPHHMSRKTIAAALAGVAAAAFIGTGLGHFVWPSSSPSAPAPSQAMPSNPNFQFPSGSGSFGGQSGSRSPGSSNSSSPTGTASSAKVAEVAAKVSPSLVDINTNLGYQGSQAAGTGIVLTSDGTVLTNNHVINGATQITATDIGNNKTYKATVVGYDRSHDIAVIKLTGASGLATASLATSNSVAVGKAVIGIGNAGGTGGTPSTASGTVTALNQSITASDESNGTSEQLTGLIQTDAPIQPGDSGGALVGLDGRVIGVDTAASQGFSLNSGASQGFAIPIDTALSIAHQITHGRSSATIHLGPTGFMGVQVQTGSSNGLNPFGGTSGGSSQQVSGVSVGGTVSGSPAEKAGLVAGDTITSIDGITLTAPEQLTAHIGRLHPGDTVTLGWTDASGNAQTAKITLAVGPAA